MKNYIANGRWGSHLWLSVLICKCSEFGSWDTSKALVRRTLEHCIHLGRQHRAQGRKQDEYEAYRLLGQAVSPITSAPLACLALTNAYCLVTHPRGLHSALEFLRARPYFDGSLQYIRACWRQCAHTVPQR